MGQTTAKRASTAENQNASFVKNPILLRARRAVIVEAAIEVFWRKGFHSTRISDIAKVAGLSQGSIYNYIESKEALLYMVCEDHLGLYRDHVSKALAGANSPRERITRLIEATVESTFLFRRHFMIMLREIHHIAPPRRRAFMRLAAEQRKFCQDILEEAVKLDEIGSPDPALLANLLLFLPSFMAARGWDRGLSLDRAAVERDVRGFILRGLGIKEADLASPVSSSADPSAL
jgi:AcrR family transcriptional regulator